MEFHISQATRVNCFLTLLVHCGKCKTIQHNTLLDRCRFHRECFEFEYSNWRRTYLPDLPHPKCHRKLVEYHGIQGNGVQSVEFFIHQQFGGATFPSSDSVATGERALCHQLIKWNNNSHTFTRKRNE